MYLLLTVEEECKQCGVTEKIEIKKELCSSSDNFVHVDDWESEVKRLANSQSKWKYGGLKCGEEYDRMLNESLKTEN